jgi:PAS domain S-box-containing protein
VPLTTTLAARPFIEEELFAMLCEQESEHALVLLDPQHRVVAWHGAATKIFGYHAEEMCGATLERRFERKLRSA